MEKIIEQLELYRQTRHDAAQLRYSEILQRFDNPMPGDAEELDKAMTELKIDRHQLEHDVHLIERYRMYLKEGESTGDKESSEQAKRDAQGIRAGSKSLFIAQDEKPHGA